MKYESYFLFLNYTNLKVISYKKVTELYN